MGTQKLDKLSAQQINIFKEKLSIPIGTIIITSIMFASIIKGGDILIKAFANLTTQHNVILILIGLDEKKLFTSKLIEMAKKYGVNDRIRWIGITDQVSDYLSISDIFVQPSRTEALSLAAVEALSFGLPVVASNVGGLPEVATQLFPMEDDEELTHILQELIDNPSYRISSGIQAREKWENHMELSKGIEFYKGLYK